MHSILMTLPSFHPVIPGVEATSDRILALRAFVSSSSCLRGSNGSRDEKEQVGRFTPQMPDEPKKLPGKFMLPLVVSSPDRQ